MDRFDYVIVGAGTAGCVLAARLSEDPSAQVALLEAGPSEGPESMGDPTAAFTLWGTNVDWGYSTATQHAAGGAMHPYPLGKVLGGSSSINAMLHLRGSRASYDAWERVGASGWNYEALLPFLQRSESAEGRDPSVRGTDGPMTIAAAPAPGPLLQAWHQAALEAGHRQSEDGNGERPDGVARCDMNVVQGRRQSAADAYLRPVLDRPNLTVISRAPAKRLLLRGTRCYGVEYISDTQTKAIEADNEVLLTAGAIGSPHLLMLSGIGNPTDLREAAIPLVLDLPGVGQNLHDHVIGAVVYQSKRPPQEGAPFEHLPYVRARSSEESDLDIQLVLNPSPWAAHWSHTDLIGYSIMFALMAPASRGAVRLAASNPAGPPVIDPGFFADERDLDRMVHGLRLAREIGESNALSLWRARELNPGTLISDDDGLRDFVRRSASTYFHPVGTCRMGVDDLAVVDNALRVHGIDGLRIADASVMPTIVTANTNATVLAIAERAAVIVRGDIPRIADPCAR
jgi:choline dehydrogenase